MLAGAGGTLRRARPRRRPGALVPGRPAARAQHGRHRRRRRHDAAPTGTPRASPAWCCSATRPRRSARWPRRSARGSIAALDLAERMSVPVEWFALSAGARISMDTGTENMDWVARALRRIVDLHPGRRRDQRRRRRHQRRRPAVLERRGDDADAHQGHPGDDAGQRDGADRQAVAGLLRRRVGRGQLRHRRLRPGDGPQRAGAVLGARPAGACEVLMSALRPHLRRAGGVPAAAGGDDRPGGPRRPRRTRTSSPTATSRTVGDIFSPATNPDRKKAFDIRTVMRAVVRPGPPGARALGRHGRRRHLGRAATPTSAATRCACSASSRGRCRGAASRPATARTPGRRARCSRGRRRRPPGRSTPPAATGRWSCWPTCPASTAHRSRCATCSWSTAPRSAGRS